MAASARGAASRRHITCRLLFSGAMRFVVLSAVALLGVCANDAEVKVEADNPPVAESVEETPSRGATGMWTFAPVSHPRRYSTHLTIALIAAVTLIVLYTLNSAKTKLEQARRSLENGQKAHIEELARAQKEKKEALEEARQQLEKVQEEKMRLQEQVDNLTTENKELQEKMKERENKEKMKERENEAPVAGRRSTGGRPSPARPSPATTTTTTGGRPTAARPSPGPTAARPSPVGGTATTTTTTTRAIGGTGGTRANRPSLGGTGGTRANRHNSVGGRN